MVGEDPKALSQTLASLGIRLRGEDTSLSALPLLKICLGHFFGKANGFAEMIVQHLPSPSEAAKCKVRGDYIWNNHI